MSHHNETRPRLDPIWGVGEEIQAEVARYFIHITAELADLLGISLGEW